MNQLHDIYVGSFNALVKAGLRFAADPDFEELHLWDNAAEMCKGFIAYNSKTGDHHRIIAQWRHIWSDGNAETGSGDSLGRFFLGETFEISHAFVELLNRIGKGSING